MGATDLRSTSPSFLLLVVEYFGKPALANFKYSAATSSSEAVGASGSTSARVISGSSSGVGVS